MSATTMEWTLLLKEEDGYSSKEVKPVKVGCFILDPPMMGNLGKADDRAWNLETVLRTLTVVCASFRAPFSIILFSVWGLQEMKGALRAHEMLGRIRLEVSELFLFKVRNAHFGVSFQYAC